MRVLILISAVAAACNGWSETKSNASPIEIRAITTIGDTADARMLLGRPTGVYFGDSGKYWINILDGLPMVFDSISSSLRTFVKQGEGPDEFRYAWVAAALPGDSIIVQDHGRLVVMSGSEIVGRRVENPEHWHSLRVVRWPDRLIGVTLHHADPRETTRTIVALLDMSGAAVAVVDTIFVGVPDGLTPVEYANSLWVIGYPIASGETWLSRRNRYHLRRFSPSGQIINSITRELEWFPGGEPIRIGGPNESTSPHMVANWVDSSGLLWVALSKPRTDTDEVWQRVNVPDGMAEGRVSAFPPAYELNSTVFEVLDAATHRLVATQQFDGYVVAVLPRNRIAAFNETDDGIPIITVYQLSIAH